MESQGVEKQVSRPHLVLVHSFPTNSVILRGLIDFLEDHFIVHFVDLPGFTKDVAPLGSVSIEGYAVYVREHVKRLGLSEYILGGISFGFLVVNHFPPPPECRCILAMEPFLGRLGMRMGRLSRWGFTAILSAVLLVHAETYLWRTAWLRRKLSARGTADRIDTVLEHLDPRTFVATARILMNWNRPIVFHDVPYVLFINPSDRTIAAEYVEQLFKQGARRLLISTNSVDHYPKTITKEYFADHIAPEEIQRIKGFVATPSSPH